MPDWVGSGVVMPLPVVVGVRVVVVLVLVGGVVGEPPIMPICVLL
jgi:hypothetical protein